MGHSWCIWHGHKLASAVQLQPAPDRPRHAAEPEREHRHWQHILCPTRRQPVWDSEEVPHHCEEDGGGEPGSLEPGTDCARAGVVRHAVLCESVRQLTKPIQCPFRAVKDSLNMFNERVNFK